MPASGRHAGVSTEIEIPQVLDAHANWTCVKFSKGYMQQGLDSVGGALLPAFPAASQAEGNIRWLDLKLSAGYDFE